MFKNNNTNKKELMTQKQIKINLIQDMKKDFELKKYVKLLLSVETCFLFILNCIIFVSSYWLIIKLKFFKNID